MCVGSTGRRFNWQVQKIPPRSGAGGIGVYRIILFVLLNDEVACGELSRARQIQSEL